jgi:DeoR/GlpR family transcriptional regulator of sugar metabolism
MGTSRVFAEERQERILGLVRSRGRVRIGELTAMFDVTERTISKDLRTLDARGRIKRTRGGAIAIKPLVELDLAERAGRNAGAKEAIARACLAEIQDGDALFLGTGSTVQRLADLLAGESHPRNLMILTNSLGVAQAVADEPAVDHLLLGGRLLRASGATVGALTKEELERFTVNVAFIGVSAISEGGVSIAHLDEALITASVVERARRVIVPLVHEKLGSAHFANICDLSDIDAIVTDRADQDLQVLCREHDVQLLEAQPLPVAGSLAGP